VNKAPVVYPEILNVLRFQLSCYI